MVARFVITGERVVLMAGRPAGVLAAENSAVLVRSFAIAVVIMAPIALWQGLRIRNGRHRPRSTSCEQTSELSSLSSPASPASPGSAGGQGPTLESLVAEINRIASTIESSETTDLDVPAGLTIGGSTADPQIVEMVLRDALDRSGLEVTATQDNGDSVRLRCHRR